MLNGGASESRRQGEARGAANKGAAESESAASRARPRLPPQPRGFSLRRPHLRVEPPQHPRDKRVLFISLVLPVCFYRVFVVLGIVTHIFRISMFYDVPFRGEAARSRTF